MGFLLCLYYTRLKTLFFCSRTLHLWRVRLSNNLMDSIEDIFKSSLNLEETHVKEGYDEGNADGLLSRKEEGHLVGLKTGFEVGEELGFYKGCINAWTLELRNPDRPSLLFGQDPEDHQADGRVAPQVPNSDPECESVSDIMDSLRLKYRAICATLNVKLEYSGYPKYSDGEKIVF